MGAPRRFDWDEARRLRAKGWTYPALADRFEVSKMAVRLACNDGARARNRARNAAYQSSGVCPECGGQATRHYGPLGQRRCKSCAGKARATNVRDGTLRCKTCREWKPDDAFPFNRAGSKAHRGRHDTCRVCSTKLRQAYRERHKMPCVGCGRPVLPPNEKTTHGSDVPRCRDCYQRAGWLRDYERKGGGVDDSVRGPLGRRAR